MRLFPLVALVSVALLAACSGSSSSGSATSASPAKTAAASSPSATSTSCGLKTTFDYIERDSEPGLQPSAQEIGNVDLANCTPTLKDFAATAGQAPGDCTQIALASDNPGYNVNATPAAPLRNVITEAGPGC